MAGLCPFSNKLFSGSIGSGRPGFARGLLPEKETQTDGHAPTVERLALAVPRVVTVRAVWVGRVLFRYCGRGECRAVKQLCLTAGWLGIGNPYEMPSSSNVAVP